MKLLDQIHTPSNVKESLHLSNILITGVVVQLCTLTGESETPLYCTANKSLHSTDHASMTKLSRHPRYLGGPLCITPECVTKSWILLHGLKQIQIYRVTNRWEHAECTEEKQTCKQLYSLQSNEQIDLWNMNFKNFLQNTFTEFIVVLLYGGGGGDPVLY